MQNGIRVAMPPPKPLMIFDGDCKFCVRWIRRWKKLTRETVDYLPSRDPRIAIQYPEVPAEQFNAAVQLIEMDGMVYSGAEAVFRALGTNRRYRWPLRAYEKSPVFAAFVERAYRFVARHRGWLWRLTF